MSIVDLEPVWLTLKLASATTLVLLLLGIPLAWWLSRSKSSLRVCMGALISLPLVLPPTVLGFYLLIFMGPNGLLGRLTEDLGIGRLSFTFTGLVIGSVFYSLPFVVQPIQNAFEAMGARPLEIAATLRAGKVDRFFTIAIPMAKSGIFTAAVLGFAHTVGEFGVVLMIGGNIPGKTKVLSVAIYDHVEALEYVQAHWIAGGMLVFSFLVLLFMHWKRNPLRVSL